MKPEKIINLKHPVSLVKYINGKIGVIDKLNTFRMFDIENYSLIGGFKVKLPENNPLENSVDISESGDYLAVAIKGKRKITVWDINKKELLHTLGWHRGEVLCVSFDSEDNYLLTGGMGGRAYLWSLELGKMVYSLPSHPDYVLSGAFSKNSMWTATGSFDGLINFTNISSMDIIYRKKAHRGAVTKIKFLKNRMISGDKTGELIVWDYNKGNIIARLQNVADMVVDMVSDEKEEFLFVVTKSKNIYLYDLSSYELLSEKFLKLSEMPISFCYVLENNRLWVGTLSGSIYIFNIFQDEEKLGIYLENKEYAKAYEIIKENPFLQRTPFYDQLEEEWEKTVSVAYSLMEKGKYNKAKEILSPYLKVPHKRNIVQNMLKDFGEFEKFKFAVINGKYPLAYSLAAKYPSFMETVYYKKMEEKWQKIFARAKKLIKIKGKEEEVKKLFAPFRGVSSKTQLIQSLFNDKQIYDLLRKYLLSKKFEEFFELVKHYPFLQDTPEYKQALKFAEILEKEIEKKLNEGRFSEAVSYARMLKYFPLYTQKALKYIENANVYSRFLHALAEKNYSLIEDFLLNYFFLEENEDYLKLKKELNEKFKIAQKEAINGNIIKIKEILGDLMNVDIYRFKIKSIIRSAYLNQLLDFLIKREKERLQKGVENYIAFFGMDNEIKDVMQMAKKLKVPLNISNSEKSKTLNFDVLPEFIWE